MSGGITLETESLVSNENENTIGKTNTLLSANDFIYYADH